jgi:hypothetical protein
MVADRDMPYSITYDFNFVVGAENINEYAIKKAIKIGSDNDDIGFYYNRKNDGS